MISCNRWDERGWGGCVWALDDLLKRSSFPKCGIVFSNISIVERRLCPIDVGRRRPVNRSSFARFPRTLSVAHRSRWSRSWHVIVRSWSVLFPSMGSTSIGYGPRVSSSTYWWGETSNAAWAKSIKCFSMGGIYVMAGTDDERVQQHLVCTWAGSIV